MYVYIYIHIIYILHMYDISIYFFPYIEDLLNNTFIILHIFYNHFVSFWLTRVCRDFLDLHKGSFTEKSSYFMPCCSINHNLSGCMKFRLYWQGRSFLQLCHDRGSYHIESSPLICSESQWTGFYMIGTFFMKELNETVEYMTVFYLKQRKVAILQLVVL